jgi:hypothetical protein
MGGECCKRRDEEESIHRFAENAWKEVTLGRPKNRCEGDNKIYGKKCGRSLWTGIICIWIGTSCCLLWTE